MELLKKSRAFLLLFVTFFFWGSVYVGGKLISDDVPAPLLGILLLNETFTPSFLVGLVLISADVILSTLETRKLAKQAQAGSDR